MKTIQINYDLVGPDRDYPKLYAYLRSYGTRARPLKSMWLVRTNKTVSAVRDEINRYVDSNDEVLVIDVTGDSWASNFTDDHIAWMKDNMHVLRAA